MKKIALALIIAFIFTLSSCDTKPKASPGCDEYLKIAGEYKSATRDGIMTVAGIESGTVDFSGVGYNDMTCSYQIEDCRNGQATMNCNGAVVKTNLTVLSDDIITIDGEKYRRIQ